MVSAVGDKLKKWVEEFAVSAAPGTPLPLDPEIAKRFGVSISTARRVLKTFADKGVLDRGPGRVTRMAPAAVTEFSPADLASGVTGTSVESIADILYRLICAGTLKNGNEVPPVKHLSREWHVSPATVIAACRLLCARNALTKTGRTYFVGSPEQLLPQGAPKEVIAFESKSPSMTELYTNHPLALAHQAMEFELLRNGYAISYVPFDCFSERYRTWMQKRRAPYGIFIPYLGDSAFRAIAADIIRLADRLGPRRPTVLIGGKLVDPKIPGACYINHGHVNTEWFRALARYLAEKHLPRVFVYCGDRPFPVSDVSMLKLWVELRHLAPDIQVRYVLKCGNDAHSTRTFVASFTRNPENHIRSILSKYTPTERAEFAEILTAYTTLDDALADTGSDTAWVFRTQESAVNALDLLDGTHTPPGRRPDIICLENRPEYFTRGITACVPDAYTIGYQMAHAIIGDYPVARSRHGYMRTPVVVLERETTQRRVGTNKS